MKRSYRVFFLLAALAAALALPPACRTGGQAPRLRKNKAYNLLLITVDSLRTDRLAAYGSAGGLTPHLDRLAEKAVIFRNVYASTPVSLPSHCTLFTGREPLAHRIQSEGRGDLSALEQTWAEAMKAGGFETYGLVSSFRLHSKFGLSQGFDTYDDSLDAGQMINTLSTSVSADKVFQRFQSWLEQRSGQKFFAWVNFGDLQSPSPPLPEYARLSENDPYGSKLAQVDHFLGEMMNLLEAKKLAAQTLVVVAGSCGEALGEHGDVGHGLFAYEETLKVPLIIRNPTVFPNKQAVERRVRLLDLLPSMLDLFGLEKPAGVQGQSFWPLLEPRRKEMETERPVYFESWYGFDEMGLAPLSGLIASHYKIISLPREELYDLGNDPGETNNMAPTEKELLAKMKGELQAYQSSHALGMRNGRGLDPKMGIEAVGRMIDAEKLIAADNLDEARNKLEAVLHDYPDRKLPQAYEDLHFIALKKKDLKQAEEILGRAAAQYPDLSRFGIALSQLLVNSGRLDGAEKICLEALARDPRLSQALILLGIINRKKAETGPARSYLEEALSLEPRNYPLQAEYASLLADVGEKARSLEVLERLVRTPSLSADPASVPLRADIAAILTKIGEADMANTLLLDIVSGGQGDSKVWTQVGLGYLEKGNLPQAMESLQKALSLDPKNALALSGLGTLHLALFRAQQQKADLDSALSYYTKAKDSSPGLVAAWNGLGVAWRYAGDSEKAIAHWRQALNVDPGFTNTYFNLGITLLESGRREEAYRLFNTCLEKYGANLSDAEKRQLQALLAEAKQ